jgi:hypothetical protein
LTGRAAENRTGGELRRPTATWAGIEEGGRGEVPGARVKVLRDPVGTRAQRSGVPAAAELCPERRQGGGSFRVCWRRRRWEWVQGRAPGDKKGRPEV